MDKYIGKVILVNLPNNKRPRYRWIIRKRDDGRYIVRTPKICVLIRDLNLKEIRILVKKHYFQRIVNQENNLFRVL